MVKLNLGSGQNNKPGYVNIDKFATFGPDIVWDLETTPWPIDGDVASEIVMFHALEHMGASVDVFFDIVKELYRVLEPNGRLIIAVPHPRCDAFSSDPTHVRPITPEILSLFSKAECRRFAENGHSNSPLAFYLDVDFEIASTSYSLAPAWKAKFDRGEVSNEELVFAANSYFNVVDEIHIVLRAVK